MLVEYLNDSEAGPPVTMQSTLLDLLPHMAGHASSDNPPHSFQERQLARQTLSHRFVGGPEEHIPIE